MTNLKINLVSDLHIDVSGDLELPGGDVLLLAGDICESRTLVGETKIQDGDCWSFFLKQMPKYDRVFYVLGNHEHYRGRYNKTFDEIRDLMPSNVTVLENQSEEYKGVLFLGATMWTDYHKGDPICMLNAKQVMNDYRAITHYYESKNLYHKLTPDYILDVHKESVKWIGDTLDANADKPAVVITHMAPSFMSVNEKYKNDTVTNGCYCSNLEDVILDHPNIKAWVHGHVHDPVDYMAGDHTRVLCNPRGYLPWEGNNGFDPAFTFEV